MKVFILFFLVLYSCQSDKKDKISENKEFEMYEMTEMALLMERMFHENEVLKNKIINQDSLGNFPEHYQTIFTAKMTDPLENDVFFKEHSKLFIESQQKIYLEKGKEKQNYNEMVYTCISCHNVKCTGPIVRIKKLYIK